MKNTISTLVVLVVTSLAGAAALAAQKATFVYENYFGDYSVGSRHEVEIEFNRESPKSLTDKFKQLEPNAEANLLVVGNGSDELLSNYVGGTRNLSNETTLNQIEVLKSLENQPESQLFFIWVNNYVSRYVSPDAPLHHPGSPFKHLPMIGRQIKFF